MNVCAVCCHADRPEEAEEDEKGQPEEGETAAPAEEDGECSSDCQLKPARLPAAAAAQPKRVRCLVCCPKLDSVHSYYYLFIFASS